MDSLIKNIQDSMPRFNADVCDGIAMKQMAYAAEYVNEVMMAAAETFPRGLEYAGYRQCTPEEQFEMLSRLPGRPDTYECSPSDVYMVQYKFRLNGAPRYRYMLLPIVGRGGIIRIRGSKFFISPALIDNLFSVEDGNIFTQLTRSRLNFMRLTTTFIANGVSMVEGVVYSKLHNWDVKGRAGVHTLLANYLFAYGGLTGTFKKYFNTKVIYGLEDINPEKYPSDKWVICESDGSTTTRRQRTLNITKTSFRLAINKKKFDEDPALRSMVAGFFYIMDHVSDKGFVTLEDLDDPRLWIRTLPHFIGNITESEAAKMEKMGEHLEGLRHYVDTIVRRQMQHEDIDVNTIEDLLVFIIKNFTFMENTRDLADSLGKRLETLRYVLFDITTAIFKLMYDLQRVGADRMVDNVVDKKFQKFPTDKIMGINSGHNEVNTLESANDCMLNKITLQVISQEKATQKNGKKKDISIKDPKIQMHPSMFHTYSALAIMKSNPTGRGRINPYVCLDRNHRTKPIEEIQGLTDNFKELIGNE